MSTKPSLWPAANYPGRVSISDLAWTVGDRTISWMSGGQRVQRSFADAPTGVALWDSPPCVIVVEPIVEGGRLDNAVVLSPAGEELLRLVPPDVVSEPIWLLGFYTVYVSNGILVAVFSTRVGDFWGKPDLATGQLHDVAEWR